MPGLPPAACPLTLTIFTPVLDYAFTHGDPRRLSHGFNYKGRLCGVDPGYEDRSVLFYCPSAPPIPGGDAPAALDLLHPLCVSECPTSAAQSFLCYKGATVTEGNPSSPEGDYTETIKYDFGRTDGYPTYTFMNRYCVPSDPRLAKQVMSSIGDGRRNCSVRFVLGVGS